MEILEFLKEWNPVIVPGLVLILDLLIIFLKRRPKTLDDFENCLKDMLNNLPYLINYVECPGHGEEKKEKVLLHCLSVLEGKMGRPLSDREDSYAEETLSEQIEVILSTPQKKGD